METEEYALFFSAKPEPQIVELSPSKYISIDKEVLSESAEALLAIQPLYLLSEMVVGHYRQKIQISEVNPLEGVWSLIDEKRGFKEHTNIIGRFMIKQPHELAEEVFNKFKEELIEKHHAEAFAEYLNAARFEIVEEGKDIKMLHIGPYSNEQQSFDIMEEFARARGLRRKYSFHRESYLKDIRTVTPEKFETVLKFQVE